MTYHRALQEERCTGYVERTEVKWYNRLLLLRSSLVSFLFPNVTHECRV